MNEDCHRRMKRYLTEERILVAERVIEIFGRLGISVSFYYSPSDITYVFHYYDNSDEHNCLEINVSERPGGTYSVQDHFILKKSDSYTDLETAVQHFVDKRIANILDEFKEQIKEARQKLASYGCDDPVAKISSACLEALILQSPATI